MCGPRGKREGLHYQKQKHFLQSIYQRLNVTPLADCLLSGLLSRTRMSKIMLLLLSNATRMLCDTCSDILISLQAARLPLAHSLKQLLQFNEVSIIRIHELYLSVC